MDADRVRADVERLLRVARERTHALLEPLGERDVHDQFFTFLSPVVWDLGHVGNFEELWLLRQLDGRPAHDPGLDDLYNAFENPRWVRGELPILTRDEALPYLADVRAEALELLRSLPVDDHDAPLTLDGAVHRMLAQHESQHQETVLQALDLRADLVPYAPATPRPAPVTRVVDDTERVEVPAGPFELGTDSRHATYDNERPAHVVDVPRFWIDRFPVTNRRWAAFVADGGYARPEHFSERGRAWLAEEGHVAPQGWHRASDGEWHVRRFGHDLVLDPREPVQHVSFFEAEAFARWAGARLPTEVEWEKAARWDPATGASRRFPWGDGGVTPARANVGLQHFGPRPVGAHPTGASALGVEQMAGDVYEWTTSPFEGYPGFVAFPYPEYSEVFFGGEDYRVLRGSSWAIAAPIARATYRNWDHPYRRQVFAGLRLAHDTAEGSS